MTKRESVKIWAHFTRDNSNVLGKFMALSASINPPIMEISFKEIADCNFYIYEKRDASYIFSHEKFLVKDAYAYSQGAFMPTIIELEIQGIEGE